MDEIKQKFNIYVESFDEINKLSGGLSNDTYLINNKFVWKEFKNKYLFDHLNEKKIFDYLHYYNLFYYDNNNFCYNYILGNTISTSYFKNNIERIITEVKSFHSLKLDICNFWYDILPKWIDKLPENTDFCSKSKIIKIYSNLNNKITSISNDDDIVLCHHDIHSGNIILDYKNELKLIDFEFSFNNYYYVDLGNIICEIYCDYLDQIYNFDKINSDIIEKILILYKKDIKNIEKIKLGIMISHFYWTIWGILVSKVNCEKDFNYNKFAKVRYTALNNIYEEDNNN